MTQNLFESCQFILRKDYQLNEKTEREIKRLGYRITNLDPIKLEIDDLNDDIFKNLFLALTSTDPIDSLCTKLNTLNFVDDPNQNIPFIDSESSLDNSKTPVLTNSETKINITISDFKTHNLLKESLGSDLDESLKQKQNDVMTHTQNCSLISSNHIYEINSQQNNRNATEVSATSEVESAQCNESQVLLGLNADYSHLADEDGFQETVYEPSKESSNDDFSNKNISDHQDKSKSDSTSDNESSLKTKDEIIGKGVAGMNKMQGTESEKTTEGEKDRKENELKTDESIEYGCHDNDQNNVNVKPVQKNEFQDDKEKTSVDDDEKKIYEKINKDTEECNADFDKRGFSKKENKPHGHVFNENIVKICIHSRNLTWVKYYFQDTGTEIEEYLNKAMFDENNHAYIIQVNEKHDLMKQNVHILNKFKVSNISDVSESEAENLKMFIKKDLACHTLKTKYDIEKQIFYVMGNADQVKSTISSLLSLRGNRDHEIYWAQWMEQKENDSSSYEMDHKQDSSLNDSKEREKNYRASEMHSELESKTFLKDFPGDVMSFTNAMAKAENSDDSSQMFKNQEKNLFKFNDYGFHNGKKRCIDSAGDKRSFFIGINELKVIVNKADITKLNVDIIVNAANRHLKHDGGVASVISKAAGSKMVRECDEFINKFGPLDVTEVFVSSGGNLNAKYIMHAVGPKWSSYSESQKNECAKHLRQTVLRCLVEASRHGAQTIALPSISAAIFRVPKELCANCYLEAVQNFDCIRQDLNLTSLQEIMFVDINDDLVNLIQETFITRWEHWNDSYLVNEDLNFAKNHLAAQKNQSRTISPKLTQTHNKTKSSPFASSLVQRATEKVYQLNRLKIYVSLKPALVSSNEMLIVIGEPFNEISGLSYFKVDDCIQKDGNLKNLTLLKVVTPNRIPHKICSLYCNVKDKKKIGQAFKHLASSLDLKYISGKEENSLVLTSKILYPGMTKLDGNLVRDFAEAVYKYIQHVSHDTKVKHIRIASSEDAYHNIIEVFDAKSDLKEIQQGNDSSAQKRYYFTEEKNSRQVGEHLEKNSGQHGHNGDKNRGQQGYYGEKNSGQQRHYGEKKSGQQRHYGEKNSGQGPLYSEMVNRNKTYDASNTRNYTDVREYHQEKSNEQGHLYPENESSVDDENKCQICLIGKLEVRLSCCNNQVCVTCMTKCQACPYCRNIFGIPTGNQPPGKMSVQYLKNQSASGYYNCDSWEITYSFPPGRQETNHPNPGKPYSSMSRKAYLPSTIEAFDILLMLKLAFMRKLTFTIGDSLTLNMEDRIIWNGIHHKTSLNGGSHSFPDPQYLERVTQELKDKGVTLHNITEEEKRELKIFKCELNQKRKGYLVK